MKHPILGHLRRNLVRGLFLVLPLLITLWLLGFLFQIVDQRVTPWVRGMLVWLGIPGLENFLARLGVPIIGLLLTALVIYLLGLLGGNLAGRRLLHGIESFILRIPVVKGVYGSARQLLDAFSLTGKRAFSKVVMIEYPRQGLYTLGFVTSQTVHRIPHLGPEPVQLVPVFLPTTPNPTSGWMILVPTEGLLVLDMTIEDAMKLIVSGGIVSPGDLGTRVLGLTIDDGSPAPP